MSLDASPSPYRPGRKEASGSLLTELVTKILSPQTTGLECARPGIGVRQRTFSPFAPSQRSGRFCPSATPAACRPRNAGQLPATASGPPRGAGARAKAVLTMRRVGLTLTSPAGDQVLRSRIIRRGAQSSATRSKPTRPPPARTRYRPGPSQPLGAPEVRRSSTSAPSTFQPPESVGQRSPSSLNVPEGSNRAVKTPNLKGVEGIRTPACRPAAAAFGANNDPAVRASARLRLLRPALFIRHPPERCIQTQGSRECPPLISTRPPRPPGYRFGVN